MTILLFPDADGAGVLFKPLLNVIKSARNHNDSHISNMKSKLSLNTVVINLNVNKTGRLLNQSLEAQPLRIEEEYSDKPVVLIAES